MLRTRVQFFGLSEGPAVSTMYWGATSDPTGAAAVRAALFTFWNSIEHQIAGGGTVFFDGEVEVVDPATGQVTAALATPTFTITTAGAGEPLPIGAQGLLQWRTGVFVNGRERRGRTFLIDPTESMSTNGSPTAMYRDDWETVAAALVADTAAALSIYSRKYSSLTRVISGTVWSKWAMLRSRRD